jgi:glycosyltransferase involved in cell wall biosynthesis
MYGPPEISVITPTKNRLTLLCEAIDSVQAQSLMAWEHLIIDDGSDDGTAGEVAHRAERDPRIRYISRTGAGSGANPCRNLGIRESKADLIVFLDSDDLLGRDCLAGRVAIMRKNADLDFATFQADVFEKSPGDLGRAFNQEPVGDDLLRFLFFECPWQTTAPIWRKSSLLKLGMFDESLPSWQDIDLHIRAIAANFHYLRFLTVDHYVRWQFEPTKVSIEQRRSPRHLKAAAGVLEKFEYVIREGPGMNWVRQRALCSLYFFVAELWVAAGNPSAGLQLWREVRRRRLGPRVLHLSGAALLVLQSLGAFGRRVGGRLAHKWKGWMRLRTNPELLSR